MATVNRTKASRAAAHIHGIAKHFRWGALCWIALGVAAIATGGGDARVLIPSAVGYLSALMSAALSASATALQILGEPDGPD